MSKAKLIVFYCVFMTLDQANFGLNLCCRIITLFALPLIVKSLYHRNKI